MTPTKVAIIKSKGWGWTKPEEYDSLAEELRDALAREKYTDGGERAEPRIFSMASEALAWLDGYGSMIFLSRGDIDVAKEVASKHPDVRVVLYTGLLPKGEVIYIGKAWGSNRLLVNATLSG